MEGISVVIGEGELIVGSQAKCIRGASPAMDYDPDYTFDLFKADFITTTGLVKGATEKVSIWGGRCSWQRQVR